MYNRIDHSSVINLYSWCYQLKYYKFNKNLFQFIPMDFAKFFFSKLW